MDDTEAEKWLKKMRPHSTIRKMDKRGFAYIPAKLQEELGIREDEKTKIPVYQNANILLMIRKGATKENVLRGIKILYDDIDLRWEEEDRKKGAEGQ